MALTGCYALLKYIVVLFNLLFWLVGLVVLVLSVWILSDQTFYLSITQDESSYYTGMYIFLAAGALMFIIGFLGCCGAYKESPCMLISFFCFLLIILVAEIAAGAWAYAKSDSLKKLVHESVTTTVRQEYGLIESRTVTFDAIQSGLHCCGASGPGDWVGSKYSLEGKDGDGKESINLGVSSPAQYYKIPKSCCKKDIPATDCKQYLAVGASNGTVYSEGCIDKLIDLMKKHVDIVIGVGIAIIVIEILGLIFSIVLCCAVRSGDRYKA